MSTNVIMRLHLLCCSIYSHSYKKLISDINVAFNVCSPIPDFKSVHPLGVKIFVRMNGRADLGFPTYHLHVKWGCNIISWDSKFYYRLSQWILILKYIALKLFSVWNHRYDISTGKKKHLLFHFNPSVSSIKKLYDFNWISPNNSLSVTVNTEIIVMFNLLWKVWLT